MYIYIYIYIHIYIHIIYNEPASISNVFKFTGRFRGDETRNGHWNVTLLDIAMRGEEICGQYIFIQSQYIYVYSDAIICYTLSNILHIE